MTEKIKSSDLAQMVSGNLIGSPDIEIQSVESLKNASPSDVSFLANKKYTEQLQKSDAGVIFVDREFKTEEKGNKSIIVCDNPNIAFSKAVEFFAPEAINYPSGIQSGAFVAESAEIGKGVHIGQNAVIDEHVSIGDGSVICAGTYLGQYCKIGRKNLIYQNVTIRERCLIGDMCIIHPGTVIGSDGYGFVPDEKGIMKLPQLGIVQIDHDVEIGSNCTIDRARFGKTQIKSGVKIDNLVHIAHNVVVGECTLLIGQCGVAGSAEIGKGCIIAAKAGINGHISIGDGVKVAGTSGVVKSVEPGGIVVGTPAESQRDFIKRLSLPKKVDKLQKKIKELEKKLNPNIS